MVRAEGLDLGVLDRGEVGGVRASSARTTLLVSRDSPCSPAHRADPRLAPPYQMRSASPGACGWTRSVNSSTPSVPLNVLAGSPRISRTSRSTRW